MEGKKEDGKIGRMILTIEKIGNQSEFVQGAMYGYLQAMEAMNGVQDVRVNKDGEDVRKVPV